MRFRGWPNCWLLKLYAMPVLFIVALSVLPDRKLHLADRPAWTHDIITSLCGLWAVLLIAVLFVRIVLAANRSSSQSRPQGFEPILRKNDERETSEH